MRAVGRQPAAGARARESRQADARRQTEAEPAEEERPFLKAWRFCCHLPWRGPGAPALQPPHTATGAPGRQPWTGSGNLFVPVVNQD